MLFKDTDNIFEEFNRQFVQVINKHLPIIPVSRKEIIWKRKPWINRSLQKMIEIKNKLYAKYIKHKDAFWYERYKNKKNEGRKMLFDAKNLFSNNTSQTI